MKGEIEIFDTGTWETLKSHKDRAYLGEKLPSRIAFLPGSSILVGNVHDWLYIWDVATLERLGRVKMTPLKIEAFPDGNSLLVWLEEGLSIIHLEEYIEK